MRPGQQHLRRGERRDARLGQQRRRHLAEQLADLAVEVACLPLGGRARREQRGALLRRGTLRNHQPGAPLGKPPPWQATQPVAEQGQRGDQQRLEQPARVGVDQYLSDSADPVDCRGGTQPRIHR